MNLKAINQATQGKTRTGGISPFSEIEVSRCYPNPNQPRKSFENIEELAESIKQDGLIQPIAVVKKQDGYMIVSGERRYRATLHAQLSTIKAHILDIDDAKIQELALVENIQREDLTDYEKAKYIAELLNSGNYKRKQDLALAIGKSSSYISKALSCLKLDESIIKDIEESKADIGLSVLEEIARIKDKATQKSVYNKYKKGEITRDEIADFKKVSRGKKEKFSSTCHGLALKTYSVRDIFDFASKKIEPTKQYKITIEEI